jgi:hypothetical protein
VRVVSSRTHWAPPPPCTWGTAVCAAAPGAGKPCRRHGLQQGSRESIVKHRQLRVEQPCLVIVMMLMVRIRLLLCNCCICYLHRSLFSADSTNQCSCCSPQGVAQGRTQISRQMPQDSSSCSSDMQASRDGVTPQLSTAPAQPVPAAAASAAAFSWPVRRCVRGLQLQTAQRIGGTMLLLPGCGTRKA